LTFRDSEKTLTDDDAGKAMTKILHGLKSEFDAILREG
jgi:phenylalanyl-tRNA synthetase beta subunit